MHIINTMNIITFYLFGPLPPVSVCDARIMSFTRSGQILSANDPRIVIVIAITHSRRAGDVPATVVKRRVNFLSFAVPSSCWRSASERAAGTNRRTEANSVSSACCPSSRACVHASTGIRNPFVFWMRWFLHFVRRLPVAIDERQPTVSSTSSRLLTEIFVGHRALLWRHHHLIVTCQVRQPEHEVQPVQRDRRDRVRRHQDLGDPGEHLRVKQ